MKSIPTIDDPPLLRSIDGLAKVVRAAVSRPETREVLLEEVRRYRPATAGRPDP